MEKGRTHALEVDPKAQAPLEAKDQTPSWRALTR